MRLFLSFLSWFFGLIFLAGSIPYFWCGEFFLGLWSLVVVIILIPPLYKFVSGRFKFSYSKTKIMAFSLIIFFALFANFVRPAFYQTESEKEWIVKSINRYIKGFDSSHEIMERNLEIVSKNMLKTGDSEKLICIKLKQINQVFSLTLYKTDKDFREFIQNKNTPNIMKLSFLPLYFGSQSIAKQQNNQIYEIRTKMQCGNI